MAICPSTSQLQNYDSFAETQQATVWCDNAIPVWRAVVTGSAPDPMGGILMRKQIVATALALMAATVGSLGVAAPAFADDHFDVTVRSTASGKCLAPQGESSQDRVPIVQVTCNGSAFQRWDFVDHDDSIFQMRNAVTLKCMDVGGRGPVNGTPVLQFPCNNNSNQRFQASRGLPDFVTLRSRIARTSSHCLDVPGGQGTEDLAMQIFACNGTASQSFGVFPV
jgi:hypothetical protein